MKAYTKEEMTNIYKCRRENLMYYLLENEVGAAVFIDSEEHRDPAVAYFTGHANDAVLVIFSNGYTVLVPWDENLAKKNGYYDKLIPYTRYKNNEIEATKAVLNLYSAHAISDKVELPPYLSYPQYLHFIDTLNGYSCSCKEKGAHSNVVECRMIKDEYEIESTCY